MNLLETVVDALWDGFEGEVCVDRNMDLIDTGETFSMERVAEHVIATLGLREESKYLEDGWGGLSVESDGKVSTTGRPPTRVARLVGSWIADSTHTAT